MDQFNHAMDHILGGIEGHYISLIHDEGGHQSKFCQEHTLVVTYCSQEHLDSMVYSKAKVGEHLKRAYDLKELSGLSILIYTSMTMGI